MDSRLFFRSSLDLGKSDLAYSTVFKYSTNWVAQLCPARLEKNLNTVTIVFDVFVDLIIVAVNKI